MKVQSLDPAYTEPVAQSAAHRTEGTAGLHIKKCNCGRTATGFQVRHPEFALLSGSEARARTSAVVNSSSLFFSLLLSSSLFFSLLLSSSLFWALP